MLVRALSREPSDYGVPPSSGRNLGGFAMGPRRGGGSLDADGRMGGGLPIGGRRVGGVSLAPVAGVVSVGEVVTAVVGDDASEAVESGGFVAYFGLSSQPAAAPTAATVMTKEAASDERFRMRVSYARPRTPS